MKQTQINYTDGYLQIQYSTCFYNKLFKQKIMNLWQLNQIQGYGLPPPFWDGNQQIYSSLQQNQQRLQPFYFVNFFSPPIQFNNNSQTLGINPQDKIIEASLNLSLTKKQYYLKPRSFEPSLNKSQKKNGNIKANIIRDFIRGIKKDASYILLAKNALKSEYPIKKFIEILMDNFPNENKYIRFKNIENLWQNSQDTRFSQLLRTVFFNFLKGDYKTAVLTKKRNKFQYLKACRQMSCKIQEGSKR